MVHEIPGLKPDWCRRERSDSGVKDRQRQSGLLCVLLEKKLLVQFSYIFPVRSCNTSLV